MTEGEKLTPLNELDKRLSVARRHQDKRFGKGSDKGRKGGGQSGIGFAFKIGADIVSALIVGVGIGLLLDGWLGTKPWFLVLFFMLGAAAGFMNVFRTVRGLDMTAGYKKPGRADEKSKAAPDKGREEG